MTGIAGGTSKPVYREGFDPFANSRNKRFTAVKGLPDFCFTQFTDNLFSCMLLSIVLLRFIRRHAFL
jgi:hypothetical protein